MKATPSIPPRMAEIHAEHTTKQLHSSSHSSSHIGGQSSSHNSGLNENSFSPLMLYFSFFAFSFFDRFLNPQQLFISLNGRIVVLAKAECLKKVVKAKNSGNKLKREKVTYLYKFCIFNLLASKH